MRTTLAGALVMALVLLMNSVLTDQSPEDLEQRVEQLEKTLLKDSYHPERTVVVRLANVEKTIESLNKDRDNAKSLDRENSARLLVELEKRCDPLQRRVKSLEEQLSRNDPHDLNRDLDRLKDDLARVETRLRRLEAK
jgi:DNA repair exonuclease SbcCD ATPase subunit